MRSLFLGSSPIYSRSILLFHYFTLYSKFYETYAERLWSVVYNKCHICSSVCLCIFKMSPVCSTYLSVRPENAVKITGWTFLDRKP